jgi:hypothetical protein
MRIPSFLWQIIGRESPRPNDICYPRIGAKVKRPLHPDGFGYIEQGLLFPAGVDSSENFRRFLGDSLSWFQSTLTSGIFRHSCWISTD